MIEDKKASSTTWPSEKKKRIKSLAGVISAAVALT
jgi:hypothetical protein